MGTLEATDVAGPRLMRADQAPRCGDLFRIFLRGGLAFGGGASIASALHDELVLRRRVVTEEEFMANYALGRIVPSGTMTALAVAYGWRFRGILGALSALAGLLLPAFTITVALTFAYKQLHNGDFLAAATAILLPIAVALITRASFKLGKDVLLRMRDASIAVAAFAIALFTSWNPIVLLVLGGVVGVLFLRGSEGEGAAS